MYIHAWPIWGMTLVDDQPVSGAETVFYQPTWKDWQSAEKTDVVLAYAPDSFAPHQEQRTTTDHGQRPPVCMLRYSVVGAQGDPEPPTDLHEEWARAFVAALRLQRIGDFVDPIEVGTYLLFPDGVTALRWLQPLRSAFYDWRPARPAALGAGDGPTVGELAVRLHEIARDPTQLNAAHTIESMCLSFGRMAGPAENALHRFVALEALLGRLHESHSGATFDVRATHALGRGAPEYHGFLARAQTLRNALAHDVDSTSPSNEDLDTLEAYVRGALLSYLAFAEKLRSEPTPGARVAAFNQALAHGPLRDAS
jgi:hypothetical protein